MIIWFTGLSGTGKSTLSDSLKKALEESKKSVFQVDGDIFRQQDKSKNRFSREEIINNNHKIISYCQSIQYNHDFILVSVISPYEETRKKARETFGKEYLEIFLDCPIEILTKRDPKRLYAKALAGEIDNLIGFSSISPYERPVGPDVVIDTSKVGVEACSKIILDSIKAKSQLS